MAAPNSNHPLEQTFIQPVLASTLYEAALNRKRRRVERIANDVTGPCTGVKAIDEVVLEGSFATQDENGAIVGIAIERALEQEQVQWWSKQVSVATGNGRFWFSSLSKQSLTPQSAC